MATLTPNIGLKKPAGSEYPKISDAVNDNADILDANIEKLQEGIAIIVDGDTAAVAVPVGGYAYIKNNQHELPDGLYKNTSSSVFPVSGRTANSSVFAAVPAGAVNDAVSALNNKIGSDTLPTTAQTLTGAIVEHENDLTSVNDNITKIRADVIADGAGAHNAIYRGKYLGSSVTAEQWAAIRNGTFADLFIGDYWTINGVNWRIAAFDYWLNVNGLSKHHVVIVPDTNLTSSPLNSTHTTAGAYYNSDFRTGNNGNTGRATAIAAVNAAFGSDNILTYKDYLHSAVVDGHPSGQEWADCTVELMNEEMVYDGHIFAPIGPGTTVYSNYTTSKSQLPLFQHDHSRISNRANWWLRSVVGGAYFANVDYGGGAYSYGAGDSIGVRPAFGIC